jgi:alpha-1,6-mannosyltransferase
VLASGLVLSACVVCWRLLGDMTRDIAVHLVLYAVAFAAYLVALWASRGLSAGGLRLCLAAAVVWRVLLVAAPPLLSDDVYRQVWEGRIQQHGGNPYAWRDRAEADKWTSLRDAVWENVNHKDYTAIYPPFWQLVARGVIAAHDSVTAVKAFLVACELVMLAVLADVLRLRGQPRERVLVAAWSPLALVEIAGSGHNDVFALLWLALGLWALERGWRLCSAVALGLGVAAKLLPAVLALGWARRYRVAHLLALAAVLPILALPYVEARHGMWRSLLAYSRYWRFNESFFAALPPLVGSQEAAVRVAALALLVLALALAARKVEAAPAGLILVAAWLLLGANVLPWYALWLLPFLVLVEAPPALLFTGTVGLAYVVYPGWLGGGPWQVPWPVRALEYGLPLLLLAAWRRAPSPRGVEAGT